MKSVVKPPTSDILLGYAVPAGEPVRIPLKHMAVTGMTQEAGKTTALEALIDRSGLRAIAFITKRGEGSFSAAAAPSRRVQPYFRERTDWVFVASLIDATLGEKNKLLRSWLMKVCRNTRTLAEVQRNVRQRHAEARGFAEGIYEEINGYLELVVPEIESAPLATTIKLGPGLNVMDLAPYSTALQGLVMRSVLDHVYQHEDGVVTVIPEAWEFVPEGRGSPVKLAAETLIRKGAGLRNYVWIDSQDLAGVSKLMIRAAAVYLVGVQREANEIKRTLANIPAGVGRPKASDIATLQLGQFYACYAGRAIKTYVQPAWMNAADAKRIAAGEISIDDVPRPNSPPAAAAIGGLADLARRHPPPPRKPHASAREDHHEATKTTKGNPIMSESLEKKVDQLLEFMQRGAAAQQAADVAVKAAAPAPDPPALPAHPHDPEELYVYVRQRLLSDPQVIAVLQERKQIDLVIETVTIEMDGKSMSGRVAAMIHGGFFKDPGVTHAEVYRDLKRTGAEPNNRSLGLCLADLVKNGFLTREGKRFREVPGMKVNIVRK